MSGKWKSYKPWLFGLPVVACAIALASIAAQPVSSNSDNLDDSAIVRGAGTTMLVSGTGPSGNFVPVVTKLAFHATRSASGVTGTLDCLALAPADPAGTKGSGQFTVNAMYVTGRVTGMTIHGNTATLTGTSSITGLGAGSNVPFTFVVERGGPGAAATLTVNTLPTLPFQEVLLEGAFQVRSDN